MADRITMTLHELVFELDTYADGYLRGAYGVSYNLFETLAALVGSAPIDITRLAVCLRVTKAAVSKRVPQLVADGWAVATPGQGRQVVLEPTDRARALVREAGGELETRFAAVLGDPRLAGEVDIAALNRQLNALTQILTEKGPQE